MSEKPWRRDPARVQAALARLKFRRARFTGGPTPSSHWPYF